MRTPGRQPLRWASLLTAAALAACTDSSTELELLPIASGTIQGIAFTVTDGTVYQARPDGPIYAPPGSGGQILLTGTPASLGMSDPDRLQLRTQFALADSGSVQIAAFGDAGNEISTGLSVVIRRMAADIAYELRFEGALFADSVFFPPPPILSAEQWVVTEFYADDVPGYGAGQSGIALWPLDDLSPMLGADVLGCTAGPAIDASVHDGEGVGLAFANGWIVGVDVVDQIVGPCI
jgi:hypothetical protein